MTLSAATSKTRRAEAISAPISRPDSVADGLVGLEILQQRRSADAEERGADVAALPERLGAGGEEDGVFGQGRRGALAERMAQDRLLGQDGKQLAGQPGPEAGNDAVRGVDPFRMGARHADEMPAGGKERQDAGELRFLAAHDIGRIGAALRQAGQDADISRLGPERAPRRQGCRRGRRAASHRAPRSSPGGRRPCRR